MAKQIGGNMRVACESVGERPARFRMVALGAENEQSSGPNHIGAAVVFMLFEQGGEFAIAAQFEEAGGKHVADALVVVGIENQQVAPMSQGLIVCSAIPQA